MSKVIYCYDREEIKDIVKEAIAEYELGKKFNVTKPVNEIEEYLKRNFVEEMFLLEGYEKAKQVANSLGVKIPHWMRKRAEK